MVVRLASVSYLNARPLVAGLADDERVDLREVPPSAVSEALLRGEADCGLVPVVTLLARPDFTWVPGVCIGADGPVDSVLLYVGRGLQSRQGRRRVALDPESRTSQMLTRVYLGESLGLDLEEIDFEERQATAALAEPGRWDAVLAIGDKALAAEPGAEWEAVDLSQAWHELTGMPFVFAVWGLRREVLEGHPWLPDVLTAAMERGMADLDRIAAAEGPAYGCDPERARTYLAERIVFRMGEREETALQAFLDRVRSLENRKRCST